ncbi:ZIP family metal transporter [Effusibacillus lacus]|uniref:Zinc/iron permease n=1 Tax=Effusibacillus lacus TaxID=1348429 RepID=A0A292YMH4_9BACL|nr:ZIP family metal transporter [Effusibacillus lacus]TCS71839.1 ZIP family zinc transporter [Effusibacillus lacus]GAX89594.1 zinc/iron permease [Effusibacillus lacus]
MWEIVGISFLTGLATPLGGWIVLRFRQLSPRLLALFLGLAAGIMITVVFSELMPNSIRSGSHEIFIVGMGGGWLFMLVLRWIFSAAMGHGNVHGDKAAYLQLGWFIALAIALHDLPEGFAIGAGDALNSNIGLIIALAIALHNIPEGMSIAIPLRLAGVSKGVVLWITILAGITTPMGTVLSLWLFSVSEFFISFSLAFAGGAMAYVVSRDILPEALQASVPSALFGMAGGGVVMLAVSELHWVDFALQVNLAVY